MRKRRNGRERGERERGMTGRIWEDIKAGRRRIWGRMRKRREE